MNIYIGAALGMVLSIVGFYIGVQRLAMERLACSFRALREKVEESHIIVWNDEQIRVNARAFDLICRQNYEIDKVRGLIADGKLDELTRLYEIPAGETVQ